MRIRELWRRAWYWINRETLTRELEEEIRIHIEFRRESLRRLAIGGDVAHATAHTNSLNADDVAYAMARHRFGNMTTIQQRSRDMWRFSRIEDLTDDLRYSWRRLLKRPAFALAVIGVTAIGIGATTAMFSAVDAAMLRPLPFQNPEQLAMLPYIRVPFDPGAAMPGRSPTHLFDLTDARKMTDIFSSVAAYASGGLNLGDPSNPARLKAGVVTSNFFSTLGIQAQKGRAFVESDGVVGAAPVVVLSYAFWQRQYAGRDFSEIKLLLNGMRYDVVGVMPPSFSFPNESDIWIAMSVPTTFATFSAFRNFLQSNTIARVAPGHTVEWASSQLLERVKQSRVASNDERMSSLDMSIKKMQTEGAARVLQRVLVGDRRSALFVLLGATGLLLLVACVNVTNLLLSQAAFRKRELAVRKVLGATRARIIRQLLTESIFLSVAGAALGVLVAPVALRLMRALLPQSLAGVVSADIDWRVVLFAALLALVTGLAFGLWPALGASKDSDAEIIKSGSGNGATAAKAGRARRFLIGAELALTVILLVGAGLMIRSFQELMARDSGFKTEKIGTMELAMSKSRSRATLLQQYLSIENAIAALPGVSATGIVNDLPLNGAGGISISVAIPGVPTPKMDDMVFARYVIVSGSYFKTMGISLLRGRVFTTADDSLAAPTIIIGKTMAEKYWPGIDPVGRIFSFGGGTPLTIIGVVADVRENKLEEEAGLQMYRSIYSDIPANVAIVAKSELGEAALLAHMRDAVKSVDRSQAIYNLRMMDEVLSKSTAPRRTNTSLISAFAFIALFLAAVGVYAVVAHGVSHRNRELGIRSALGATGRDLLKLISQEMLVVAVIGLVVGLAGAWALARTLSSLVYGVDLHDPTTYALVPLALLVPTLLATLVPARRAMHVNPSEVMRAD